MYAIRSYYVLPVPQLRLRLEKPVSESPEMEPPPPKIVQALSRLMLYRMQERARKDLEKGNIDSATRQLQVLASNLLTQGERSLAQTILLEVDHLQKQNSLTIEGSKKIKYGTRSLLNAPVITSYSIHYTKLYEMVMVAMHLT